MTALPYSFSEKKSSFLCGLSPVIFMEFVWNMVWKMIG